MAAACGESGTGRFAGLSIFESADGTFIIRYRNPPWERVDSSADSVTLEVKRVGASLGDADAGLVGSKYWLTANLVTGDASACVDAALAQKPMDATMVEEKKAATTAHGDKGFEATYRYPIVGAERYLRVLCLTHSTADSLEVRMDSIPNPGEAEVDEMLAGIEIRKGSGP